MPRLFVEDTRTQQGLAQVGLRIRWANINNPFCELELYTFVTSLNANINI